MFSAPPHFGCDVEAQNCAGLPIHHQGRAHRPKRVGTTSMAGERELYRVARAATQRRVVLPAKLEPTLWWRCEIMDQRSVLAMLSRRDEGRQHRTDRGAKACMEGGWLGTWRPVRCVGHDCYLATRGRAATKPAKKYTIALSEVARFLTTALCFR